MPLLLLDVSEAPCINQLQSWHKGQGLGAVLGGKHHSHGFSSFYTGIGCSARTAPCWLPNAGLAWRRTGAGASSRDSKNWLVAVVAGRQRHSAQCRLLQPGPSVMQQLQREFFHKWLWVCSRFGLYFLALFLFFSSFLSCQLSQQAHNNPMASPRGHSCWLGELSFLTGTKESLPTALSGQAAPPILLALFHQGKHLPGPPGTAGPWDYSPAS